MGRTEAERLTPGQVALRFDRIPGKDSAKFIEAEDHTGKSIRLGEWRWDGVDGLLVIDDPRELDRLRAERDLLAAECQARRDYTAGKCSESDMVAKWRAVDAAGCLKGEGERDGNDNR